MSTLAVAVVLGAALNLRAQNNVTLRWDPSPSSSVRGYRVYYGETSEFYTNSVDAGGSTSLTLAGLKTGLTYYFVVSAFDVYGQESDFSNEASYTVPEIATTPAITLQLRSGNAGAMILTGVGAAQRTYDVQASADLRNWMVIARLTVLTGGTLNFTDTNAVNYSSRFYRVAETRPEVQLRVSRGQPAVVTALGQFNHTYEVQTSPNLRDWTVLGGVTVGTNGTAELIDAGAMTQPARFYRTHEI